MATNKPQKRPHWIWSAMLAVSSITIALSLIALYFYYVQIYKYAPPTYSFSEAEIQQFDEICNQPMGCVAIDVETDYYGAGGLTGVVIKSNGCHYIITAADIKEDFETIKSIRIYFPESPDMPSQNAELIYSRNDWGIALLKFSNPNYIYRGAVARLASSSNLEPGAKLTVVRRNHDIITGAFITEHSLGGVIPAPDWLASLTHSELLFSTAITEGGYSGGPMLNQNGEVVAICSGGRISPITGERILSFGTRVDWIRTILNDLRNEQSLD